MGFLLKIPYLRHESFDLSDDTPTETTTPLFHRVACGLGHVLNDVIRQLFFSFRLVYFMNVLGLSASLSGWLLLEKPLVHIVLSPVSAILVDRVYIPFVSRKIGKRKSWHLLGTILEAVFIPFFFATHYLIQSENSKTELMMIHLGILNVILAFGDGILDISHLSLIAVIARDQMEAVEMNSLRTSFSYLSGILTFVVAWVIFGLDSESQLSESSSRDFMVLTAVLVAVGVLSSLIFYSGTKEPSSSPRIPLRKLSTLAATNLARLTSFVPSGGLGEPMPNFATGLKIARKKSRPARKSSHRVSLCDGIRWKPTKCDTYTYEENTLLRKKEPLKENHRYRSASLPNDTNSIGVINQGLHASVLDRCKEPAPVNGSTMRAPLSSKTEANSQPVLNSGFNTARKESCPARIMTRVNFCVETQRKPTECNMNEEKMSQEEKEPRNQSCQSRSSSLLSDPYRTGVVNKGFSVSVLDLYSDDESNYTGRVTKEAAPINQSAVSLETKNDLLPDTKPNSQVAINSELNTANKKNRPSRKKACVTFWDEIPSTPPKDDANERHTLSNEEEAPIDNPQSWSSSFNDPDLTGVVSRGRNVSFLERYSDDRESTGTSRAGKELAPSDKSTLSLDTKSVSFSQIKSDRKPVVKSCNTESGLPRSTRGNKTVRRWLIDPRLYLVSIAYSCTWMLQIHAYSYLPLFLLYRLRFSKESIAYLPLILTISATVSSSFSKKILQKIGDKLCFIFAAIFAFIAGVMSYFMEAESWISKVMIYPTVILLGFGFSSMFVNSLSLATELIGKNTKTTGFVFAVMTLIASVTNGSLLMTIQELFPKQRNKDCEECGDYLRLVFSLVNVAVAIVSVITVLLLYCINRFKGKSSSSDED